MVSTGGIFFIVWRKLPYLEKLAKSENSDGVYLENNWSNFFYDLCPEVWDWATNINIKEYKEMWLVETEKLLRRLRVASLKMDRFSDSLIKKIRRRVYSGNGSTFAPVEESRKRQNEEIKKDGKAEFKKNEQKLIIEIAKNPKNAVLYEELGDLYTKTGDYLDAKESYEAATELSPQSESLKQKLSFSLEKLNSSS